MMLPPRPKKSRICLPHSQSLHSSFQQTISLVHRVTSSDKLSYSVLYSYYYYLDSWEKHLLTRSWKIKTGSPEYFLSSVTSGGFKIRSFFPLFALFFCFFPVEVPKESECVAYITFTFSNKCLSNVTSSCNIIWCSVETFCVRDVKLRFIFHPPNVIFNVVSLRQSQWKAPQWSHVSLALCSEASCL